MDKVRIIEIKESVFADNDREAERLRAELKREKTFLLNLMSSPGSGKTTLLMRTIEALKEKLRIGVLEADIDSAVDAEKSPPLVSRPFNSTTAACATWMLV